MGILSPAFRKKKEGQSVLASAVFQVSLTQKFNQYAKAAYFGVACPEPLQYLCSKTIKKKIKETVNKIQGGKGRRWD